MSNNVCISKAQWDQTRELLAGRKADIESLLAKNTKLMNEAYELNEQLAAQRRTIATLRARLQGRKSTPRSIWASYFEWPLCLWPNVHEARIAAIRNFGALP